MAAPTLTVIHGIRQRPLSGQAAAQLKASIAAACQATPGGADVAAQLLGEIDRATTQSEKWSFTMLNVQQQAAVLDFIRTQAARPMLSLALWAEVTRQAHKDTGAITCSRQELAAKVGSHPTHVSAALAELVRANALLRIQNGRSAIWLLNPNIATRLPGKAGEDARRKAGPLRIVGGTDAQRIEDDRQEELPT